MFPWQAAWISASPFREIPGLTVSPSICFQMLKHRLLDCIGRTWMRTYLFGGFWPGIMGSVGASSLGKRRLPSLSSAAPMPITVSIVEDNEQLRGTLARVINRAEGFRCVSQYGDAESALEGLLKDKPEVVLMDINLPGMNGVECVRRLKQAAPPTQVVMLTVYEDTENI